jgi:hypothetical protein
VGYVSGTLMEGAGKRRTTVMEVKVGQMGYRSEIVQARTAASLGRSSREAASSESEKGCGLVELV